MFLPFTWQQEELFLYSLHVLSTMPVLQKHKTCNTVIGREHNSNQTFQIKNVKYSFQLLIGG